MTGNSLVEPSTVAYEQVFGPFHGWTAKKALVAALQELPSRDLLFKTINEEGKYSMLLYILLMAGAIGAFINIPFKERFYTTFIEYIKICEPIKSF